MAAYLLRLVCLSAAVFFVTHAVLTALLAAVTHWLQSVAEPMTPRDAARLFWMLRLFPTLCSLGLVAGLCIPPYLQLEPVGTGESINPLCLLAAAAGVWIWMSSLTRTVRALVQSLRCCREWERSGVERDGEVLIVDSPAPVLAVAGILRPRLIASRRLLKTLPADQIEVAVKHEKGHRDANDNLKRLTMLLAPRAFWGGAEGLERAWSRASEQAADDQAVNGDPALGVALAAALVGVARLHTGNQPALTSPLVGDGTELARRVERLLKPARPVKRRTSEALLSQSPAWLAGILLVLPAIPGTGRGVYEILEELIR